MQVQLRGVDADVGEVGLLGVELIADVLEIDVRDLPALLTDEVVVLVEVRVVPGRGTAQV